MDRLFSAGFSLERVNPAGIVIMLIAVAANALARPIAQRIGGADPLRVANRIRIGALLLCCIGAAIAILG